jgi:hypothetical protein
MPVSIDFAIKNRNLRGLLFIIGLGTVIGLMAVVGVRHAKKKGKEEKGKKTSSPEAKSNKDLKVWFPPRLICLKVKNT